MLRRKQSSLVVGVVVVIGMVVAHAEQPRHKMYSVHLISNDVVSPAHHAAHTPVAIVSDVEVTLVVMEASAAKIVVVSVVVILLLVAVVLVVSGLLVLLLMLV